MSINDIFSNKKRYNTSYRTFKDAMLAKNYIKDGIFYEIVYVPINGYYLRKREMICK